MESAMPSKSSIFSLPTELLDKIIGYLPHKGDVVHLRKAHRDFQPSAQQVILRDVHLHLQCERQVYDFLHLGDFYDAACNEADMFPLIRTLYLEYKCLAESWHSDSTVLMSGLGRDGHDMAEEWANNMLFQIGVVKNLLVKFPQLEKITLRLAGENLEYLSDGFLFSSLSSIIDMRQVPIVLECNHST
jgi:hypothetical protein